MFARIRREVGTPNVLVNSAGINDDQLFPLMRNERWWRVINTNLGSVVNCCRCVLPPMISRREGVIVNISSVSGHRGRAGQTAYSASKAAIDGFSRSLAQEVTRYGIIVNCLAPGFIATDMVSSTKGVDAAQLGKGTPIGRIGRPEEVAELVSVLASRRASYVVGQVITIDGGGWT
jgi:3-oxoacyl-[acyl-carrier protein] reductase